MSLSLRIVLDAPDLSGWRDAVSPRELHEELGQEYARLLGAHFLQRDGTPNAKGFPRKNFWRGVADATAYSGADDTGATVTISGQAGRAWGLRYFGGVVRPATAKALALPMRAEASAAGSPREIPGLFVFRSRATGRAFLARREGGALRVYYLLLKSATHRPDPSALPDPADTARTLATHAADTLRLALQS